MRTLQPESRIAHYRIVGPLGAGGMGEVYLAQDEKLERNVALKILPPELVKSEDRVRRFLLEAKSASSLNHPHIVTVYEVGHDVVRAPDESEETSSEAEPVHYIAMELVSGKTLHELVYNDNTDLRTLLGYLAQAAEGVSKAHAAGIVHRDLKPGNIMVTGDGYAKVLDFGLAKLTERGVAQDEATQAPTEAAMTGGGVVLGTVGYMAPEQVKGKGVDHRADVFAFGCMLYEAATRQRPFVADSHIETMHKILNDKPPPIREVNAEVPSELRRLIRRCLAKNPDQRLQSIKDLALELREVVDEYDELSATATSGTTIEAPQIVPELRRRPGLAALVGAAVIVGLVGAAFGLWALLGNRGGGASEEDAPFANTRMSVLMSDSNVLDATLSADGRFLAYVKGPTGQWSLWVRQVATGSDVEILKPQSTPLRGVSFSPDGNYLYYLGRDPETPLYSALFEVPSLGGSARKRLFDVDTGLAFSPDGKQAAFVRGLPPPVDASALMIVDLTTGQEKTLATVNKPRSLPFLRPAWSPDGSSIAAVVASQDRGYRASIVAFDAADGIESSILEGNRFISSIAWLQDGSGLVATGPRGAGSRQVFLVSYPSGSVRMITNDVDSYGGVSLSREGDSLTVQRTSSSRSMWTTAVDGAGEPRQITSRSDSEAIGGVRPAEDGSIVFAARKDRYRQLWVMAGDGSGRRQITSADGWAFGARLLPGANSVVFTLGTEQDRVWMNHIWRVDLDGGNLVRLSEGERELLTAVSPDGRTMLFTRPDTPNVLWRRLVDGGEPSRFLSDTNGASYSPDGSLLSYSVFREVDDRTRREGVIIPAAGGERIASFLRHGDASDPEWIPGGRALTYIVTTDGVKNIWGQPVDEQEPVQVTRLTEGRVLDHEWSPDGTRIALTRRLGEVQNIWVVDADGRNPREVTDFRTGQIFEFDWARDGKSLVFVQGELRREVVMIRDVEEPS